MDKDLLNNIIKKFLLRYFFILRSASRGWSVRYIGDNQFTFYKSKRDAKKKSTKNFIRSFQYEII